MHCSRTRTEVLRLCEREMKLASALKRTQQLCNEIRLRAPRTHYQRARSQKRDCHELRPEASAPWRSNSLAR
jgi:hypothetical protein